MKPMKVYHSTEADCALAILRHGFALDQSEYGFGSVKGRGVYCATTVSGAAPWYNLGMSSAPMTTLTCELKAGLRIAWIEKDYDQKIVAWLRKEFGKEILDSPHTFRRALPKNKQLTKTELLALVGYFFHQRQSIAPQCCGKRWEKNRLRWWRDNFAHLRKELALHQFEALGDRSEKCWDSDEIVVFNPAHVIPKTVHRLDLTEWVDPTWGDEPQTGAKPRLLPELEFDTLAELAHRATACKLEREEITENWRNECKNQETLS